MSSCAVSVRTVFFECPLRWFRRPAGASLSRWSSSSALRTRSASAFFSSSKSPSLLKTSFGSRPSRSWSRVSFLIAISALRRRHYGPAHKIPDSPPFGALCLRLLRLSLTLPALVLGHPGFRVAHGALLSVEAQSQRTLHTCVPPPRLRITIAAKRVGLPRSRVCLRHRRSRAALRADVRAQLTRRQARRVGQRSEPPTRCQLS